MILIVSVANSQIITKSISVNNENVIEPYDSLLNYLGEDYKRYIGQDFYLKGKSENMRSYGYENFVLDLDKSFRAIDNAYKGRYGTSNYDSIAEKYFKVIDAEETKDSYGNRANIKLVEKKSNDTLYYIYDTQYEHNFPFLVVGYFNKLKNELVNKDIYIGNDLIHKMKGFAIDLKTNEVFDIIPGQLWSVKELVIDEKYYKLSLIVENKLGNQIDLNEYELSNKRHRFLTKEEGDVLIKKYGKNILLSVLKQEVKIGMSKELCKMVWGVPDDINKTTNNKGSKEQWVYPNNYLYFENEKLVGIQ